MFLKEVFTWNMFKAWHVKSRLAVLVFTRSRHDWDAQWVAVVGPAVAAGEPHVGRPQRRGRARLRQSIPPLRHCAICCSLPCSQIRVWKVSRLCKFCGYVAGNDWKLISHFDQWSSLQQIWYVLDNFKLQSSFKVKIPFWNTYTVIFFFKVANKKNITF